MIKKEGKEQKDRERMEEGPEKKSQGKGVNG